MMIVCDEFERLCDKWRDREYGGEGGGRARQAGGGGGSAACGAGRGRQLLLLVERGRLDKAERLVVLSKTRGLCR